MQRLRIILTAIVFAALLSACGTRAYKITTHNGQEYIAQGAPEYNVKSETYTFTDDHGKEVVINKDDIQVIKEQ